MKIELRIRDILSNHITIEKKVEEICVFMNWDKEKLTKAIIKHGTLDNKQRNFIINEFWDKGSSKNKDRRYDGQ